MIARDLGVPHPTTTLSLPAPVHYVSFIAGVNEGTVQRLLFQVNQQIQFGARTVHLLLSTPGGDVAPGVALYNALIGLPCQLVTHNIGNVDSIGNVVFLAGNQRYAVPNATFMFHGVGLPLQQFRLEQKNGKAILDGLAADTAKITGVLESRAKFADREEIAQLFVHESMKDTSYAKEHAIIDDVRNVEIPQGSPFVQLVF
jgi:ATP-dependent Clp protease protease subunit